MKEFRLKHVALWSKGHYVPSDDFWMDMVNCLKPNGYCCIDQYDKPLKIDIARIIINEINNLLLSTHPDFLMDIVINASPSVCYIVGYDVENKTYDYWEAMVRSYVRKLYYCSKDDLGWIGDVFPDNMVMPLTKEKRKDNLIKEITDIKTKIETCNEILEYVTLDDKEDLLIEIDYYEEELNKLKNRLKTEF